MNKKALERNVSAAFEAKTYQEDTPPYGTGRFDSEKDDIA